MGKQVTILPGFSNVELPTIITLGGINGYPATKAVGVGSYNAGQTAILTNAEYSALPSSVTRCLSSTVTTVPEPFRPSADPSAQTPTVPATTLGTIALAVGFNQVGPITGATTLSLTSVGWTAGTKSVVSVLVTQDATGSRTLTQPTGVKWAGGSAPTMTATANKSDYYVYFSVDGGTTVYGYVDAQNM